MSKLRVDVKISTYRLANWLDVDILPDNEHDLNDEAIRTEICNFMIRRGVPSDQVESLIVDHRRINGHTFRVTLAGSLEQLHQATAVLRLIQR